MTIPVLSFVDRVIFTPVSSGTGPFVESAAVAGYQTMESANAVDGQTYAYAAQSTDKSQWEVGYGTWTLSTKTLARTTILFNSLGTTSAVSFSAAPQVTITLLGEVVNGLIAPPVFDNGTVSSGTKTISASNGTKQKLTVSGSFTLAYSSWAASGNYNEVELQLVNGGTSVTWPTVNWMVGDGTTSTTFAAMGVALQSSGTNWVVVWTVDGGTTLYGRAS